MCLINQQPDLMINISASPFDYDHDKDREEIVRANVLKYGLPMFYCNAIGSQTEIVFDGGSLVMDANGQIVKEMKYFEEDFAIVNLDEIEVQKAKAQTYERPVPEFDKDMRVSKVEDPEKIIEYLTSDENIGQIKEALDSRHQGLLQENGFYQSHTG